MLFWRIKSKSKMQDREQKTIGDEGMAIVGGFDMNVGELQYEGLATRFSRYFDGRENKMIYVRPILENDTEGEREELEPFMKGGNQLSPQFQLRDLRDNLEMRVVIKGMRGKKLQAILLQIADLNTDMLRATCAQFAMTEGTIREIGMGERTVKIAATLKDCMAGQERVDDYS